MHSHIDLSPNATSMHKQHIAQMVMSMMGVDRLAYIRQAAGDDGAHIVYAADGSELAQFSSRDAAVAAIQKFNLMLARLH